MPTKRKTLTRQLVLRLDDETREALVADAESNGRTMAQSARHLLRQALRIGGKS